MNNNQRTYSISNEHLLLIDILNTMYNDNLRQINNLTESNNQIRNLIIQILNNQNNSQRRNNTNNNRLNNQSQRNTFRDNNTSNTTTSNLGRIILNNRPYIIDSVEQFRIPFNRTSRNINLNNNNDFSNILQSFFDPVEVYPTPSQIEAATRRVRYCDIISPKNTSCPISLTNFTDNDMVTVIRHCGHIFNTDELNTWFRSHCNCPVCRYDIRDDNSNASSAFSSENQTASNSSSSQSSSQSNRVQNTSSNLNIERNSFVNNFFESLLTEYISEHGLDIINSLGFTDASGNTISEPMRFLRQFNQQNNS